MEESVMEEKFSTGIDALPFGLPVLDNLERAYRHGDDTAFLDAVREFVRVSERLPKGGLLGHKYVKRLLALC
jgi:hypothetical protein